MRSCVLILMVLSWTSQHAGAVTEAQRVDAIHRIQTYLLSQQDPETGSWDNKYGQGSRQFGGETALVTYALIRSGISVQEPRMQAAIEHLKKIRMIGTYAISLRTHCWAAMSEDYRPQLMADARWLLSAQVNGLFAYGPRTGPYFDHSLTQYGLLGLWESSKRQGPNAARVWQQAAEHFIGSQNPDGGWGYKVNDSSKSSMTAAGLTSLLIAQENLHRGKQKPPEDITQAINGGISWLDTYIFENGIDKGDALYYLVSLERAALACGIRTLGGLDWQQAGAQAILDRERGTGSISGNLPDTAFALIFLSRGGVPVWANKLQLPGRTWNNRPNDLSMQTRQLSDQIETELGWQVLDARSDTSLWLNAPLAYVASDGPVMFSEAELANLKTFLDLGGILLATPDGGSKSFSDSIRTAAAEIYPGYKFERAGDEHPLMGLVHPVDLPEDKRPWVLSNGVRDLIVLAPADWGMTFQLGRDGQQASDVIANLHALVTERGREAVGLDAFMNGRQPRSSVGNLRVVRVVVGPRPPLEPVAWYPLSDPFFDRTGLELEVVGMPIKDAVGAHTKLVYLGGSEPARLTASEVRQLVGYINRGGTIMVETIGGRGQFTTELLRQFEAILGEPAVPMSGEHPIVTGKVLNTAPDADGYDMRRVGYRRYSTLNRGPVDTPRLLSISLDGRDVVIASHEDISMGVLGAKRWGIDGYDHKSARGLLTNILLYAAGAPDPDGEKTPTDTSASDQGVTIEP